MGDSRAPPWRDLFLDQDALVPADSSTIPSSIYYRKHFAADDSTPREAFASNFALSSLLPLWFSWMLSMRIDFILSRAGLDGSYVGASSCCVVNSSKDSTLASDHCGVIADLKFIRGT